METRSYLLLVLIAVPACGSDGHTPVCPELPRYDIRKASDRANPDVLEARRAAVEAGCVTAAATAMPPASGGGGNGGGGGTEPEPEPEPEPTAGDGGASPAP